VGTTITAFIAAMFNSNAAISIALAHFLFNAIGVMIFFLIPFVKEFPLFLANGLGQLTLRYRLAGFLYLLLMFFFIPFSLIYFNKDAVKVQELTYRFENMISGERNSYKLVVKTYYNQPMSNWMIYDHTSETQLDPAKILSVYRRKNILIINNELFELNKAGFCRDGEDDFGKYQNCIIQILPKFELNSTFSTDSVYVFEKQWYQPARVDSTITRLYISASTLNLLVKKEKLSKQGTVMTREELLESKEEITKGVDSAENTK
jgi:solute carrier family 34 (sodium-dependent phosphate cotransporter)